MDCYSRMSLEEFLVCNYQESSSSETNLSNGMWCEWSMNSPDAAEKCFQGIKEMDDIFLSSILEDVPENDGDTMYGGSDVPMFHCYDMSLKEGAPFTTYDLSEENMLDSLYVDELVLQDLQRASQKLTDETRKCFRDTFYRLARNSLVKFDSVSTNSEEFNMQASIYDYVDDTRLSIEEEIESEANSIDRAVANLIYNKMESNISNFPLYERV